MIEVLATSRGYYKRLREAGERFAIDSERDMGRWMQRVQPAVSIEPEQIPPADPVPKRRGRPPKVKPE